jgi:integrase
MTKFELEQVDVTGDGRVVLYKRPNLKQPKWQARIRVTGATGYKRFSTQETNLAKAQQIALSRYEELYFKVKQGGSLNDKTVQKVYKEWVKSIELDNRNQDIMYARQVELRLLPLLGGIGITDVSAGDLSDIIKSISNLASSTRRSYRTAFNRFFAYAYSKKYVTAKPAIEAPALKRNPRPDFSNDEWRKLYTFMRTWVTQTTKGHRGKNGLDHKRHRERFYLQHYVLTLANTGIRVGEARNLRWVDLDKVEIEPPQVYRRAFCSKLTLLFQGRSSFRRKLPPLQLA